MAKPLTLLFDTKEFTPEQIAEVLAALSDLSKSLGGGGLKIVRQTMTYRHQYSITRCHVCNHDLTQHRFDQVPGVHIETDDGNEHNLLPSCLDAEGYLEDTDDVVKNGLHVDTRCGNCGEPLKSLVTSLRQ